MSLEKRDERNKKRRKAYKRKKGQHLHIETTNGSIVQTLLSNNIDITTLLMLLIYVVTIGRWSGCIKQEKYGS
jgi:hypothetical protein